MTEQDTIKLLRECDSGVKMGIDAIEDVVEKVSNEEFRGYLIECRKKHQDLVDMINRELEKCNDDGKDPNPIVEAMSKMKTEFKTAIAGSDQRIADLMTDGCNMGVKSLSRYLNKYKAADEVSKDIAKKLIAQEENLAVNIRKFL